MIRISILGVDPYLVRQLSKDLTPKLSELLEVKKDDIWFYAPECLLIHDGVEQNIWNVLVKVSAPEKVKPLQDKMAELIRYYVSEMCVHIMIEFDYYNQDNSYVFTKKDHPLYMTESNTVIEDDESFEEEEGVEPYLGNVFEGFEEKLKEKK